MAYTVQEVSELSGVSIRTLRYYDQIGLLNPAYYGDNGYRYYEQAQLVQLQHILFFRELDMPLSTIQELIIQDSFDQLEALNHHRELLLKKAERLQTLIQTVDRTIAHLNGDCVLEQHQLFNGFDTRKQSHYVKELRQYYGTNNEWSSDSEQHTG
ncbi:MerR family transcriptional regulator [Paenibacillus sp. ACRRX]|uniref:MerR family transcriptional regulator n=1 Tax=unclassified Paenibacillus TaxID=185978 RepID=UPI001EF481A2|nr:MULTISPECIES: MerR family transcriptional regulator [unclassified Paenibacillus]MCG7407531.1 MerR family transcriptional regulator [Paenibacillus sp. ACRRX]MDK8180766.1 MerR family transcriptional regulator [Paenibacillus sp. UMB4589-SE434]